VATTILLARHGETDWNLNRQVQGHSDTPLNETGRAQARALAEELAGERIDAVYSSDLVRAHETATIVAEPRALHVTALPDLREKDFGTWEGLTDDEILVRFPDARRGQWGDGETTEEVARRVVAALLRIAESHPGGQVLVVSHRGALRTALAGCGVEPPTAIANGHVARIAVRDGVLRQVD
jgi:alpha-ribazole phosphatase/probable phosphoglycerate mutase